LVPNSPQCHKPLHILRCFSGVFGHFLIETLNDSDDDIDNLTTSLR
jgi:hypothetical protein